MPIKIDAPRAWGWRWPNGKLGDSAHWDNKNACEGKRVLVHIVSDADLRKLKALWRAAEGDMRRVEAGIKTQCLGTREALDALRGKEEKSGTR